MGGVQGEDVPYSQWPGAFASPDEFDGRPLFAWRPSFFFRKKGPIPADVVTSLAVPPGFEHMTRAAFTAMLKERIAEREAELREQYQGKLHGAEQVLAADPFDAPKTREHRRAPNPHLAAYDPARRLAAIIKLRAFRAAYRKARAAWRAGDAQVEFPYGTWWMKHFSPARVAVPPTPGHATGPP